MMKKLAFFICAAVSLYLISCTNQTASMSESNTSMEKKNLEADSIIGKAFETGDPSKIDSVVATDFVDHTDRGDMNRDSLKMFIKLLHDSMPDMKMEMINSAASGDYVYSNMRFTGSSNGFMGMPKGPYDWHVVEVSKFKDGKAVEHWEYMDSRDAMKMGQEMMQMNSNKGNMSKPADSSKTKAK